METLYKYYDLCTWGAGRALLWLVVGLIVALIILWFIEHVLAPIGEAIRDTWWRWTKRCPKCGCNK